MRMENLKEKRKKIFQNKFFKKFCYLRNKSFFIKYIIYSNIYSSIINRFITFLSFILFSLRVWNLFILFPLASKYVSYFLN